MGRVWGGQCRGSVPLGEGSLSHIEQDKGVPKVTSPTDDRAPSAWRRLCSRHLLWGWRWCCKALKFIRWTVWRAPFATGATRSPTTSRVAAAAVLRSWPRRNESGQHRQRQRQARRPRRRCKQRLWLAVQLKWMSLWLHVLAAATSAQGGSSTMPLGCSSPLPALRAIGKRWGSRALTSATAPC